MQRNVIGKKIHFTSARDSDLELYEMNIDGSNQHRLTNALGYDGGAFYSQDGPVDCVACRQTWRAGPCTV
jgi:Tol biopolymer transport system component